MRRLYILLFLCVAAATLQAQIPAGYYDSAEGLTGTQLKAALHDIIDEHTTITYDNIWNAFKNTDTKGNNVVWDMYSDGANYTYNYNNNQQCGTYEKEGDCFNREHSWPKNWFNGDESTVPGRDLHHIFPTDGYVNAQRSNYPYGEVQSASWTSANGSKLGTCKSSLGYNGTVFEPIDEYKGDFARALMYMSVRYYGEDSGWGTSGMTNKSVINDWAMTMLLRWHHDDPVDDKERNRNNVIYSTYQHNRNPFIDNEDFAYMIWDHEWTNSYQIAVAANPVAGGSVSLVSAVADTVSIDFSAQGYSNEQEVTGATIDDNVSVAFNKGTNNSNPPKYYASGTAIRCYGGNYFTVGTTSGSITKIKLTYGGSDGSNAITTNAGSFSTNTWTGNESSVTFTIGGTSGNRRIKAIEVIYSHEGSPVQQAICANGTLVTITATPNASYHFVNWTKGGTEISTNQTYNFTVSENATYQANFEINTYTISVAANTGGSAFIGDAPSPSTTVSINFSQQGYTNAQDITDVNVDDNIIITFGKGNNTQNSPKYYTSDASVRCYAKNTIVVSKKANSNVSITSITLSFASYSPAATITPNVGALSGATWSGNSSSVTFTLGDSGQRRITQMSITYSGGAPATEATFNHGATATITAVPTSGYSFVNWTKDNAPVSANVSYEFTVTEAGAYTANFTSNTVSESTLIPSLTLAENVTFTINPNIILTVDGPITQATGAKIVIEDGGQLVNSSSGVTATVKKNVTQWVTSPSINGWHAISTPVNDVNFNNVANLTSSAYNVYRLNEPNLLWENSQDVAGGHSFSTFEKGRGYLYRKGDNSQISYNGTLNYGTVTYPLTYTSAATKGFHLIGNPYPHNIYKGANAAIPNTYLEDGFYTLSSAGGWVVGYDHTTPIAPCQAILVQAKSSVTSENLIMTNTTATGVSKDFNDNIMFAVSNSSYEDVAYAVFKDGHGLNKVEHRNEAIQKLYIQYNGEDFAIANIGEDTHAFNLNFHTPKTGIYTMNIKPSGDFSYLHLIDNIIGEDIDLLLDDEYSFVSSKSDKENRFVVKFKYQSSSDSDDEIFVYQSGDEMVVDGVGELQIFDVMGRIVSKQYVNGMETIIKPSQNGVYIFRLIGESVKTQKIVVK